MAREHPDYRDTMEMLNSIRPGTAVLKTEDVMEILGVSKRTVRSRLGHRFVGSGLSKVILAKYLCGQKV